MDQSISSIVKAMPHWRGFLSGRLPDEEGDTLRELAIRSIFLIDQQLAYGSETAGLGYALGNIRDSKSDDDILGNLSWWDQAYQAWYLTMPSDGQGHGRAVGRG